MYDNDKVYEVKTGDKTMWASGSFMNKLLTHPHFTDLEPTVRHFRHSGLVSVCRSGRNEVVRKLRNMSGIPTMQEPKLNAITRAIKKAPRKERF